MQLDQLAIALTGATAAWLTQSRSSKARRFACIFGIVGQPFWFWAALQAEQWGIFAVSVLYSVAWLRGLWVHWIKPTANEAPETIEFPKQHL